LISFVLPCNLAILSTLDNIAERYVKLVLALGKHDQHYVDAYSGPPEWRAEVEQKEQTLATIRQLASSARVDAGGNAEPRARFLATQLKALITRVDMLEGKKMTFDEESAALYDVVDSGRPGNYYEDACQELEKLLPGTGSLAERFERQREKLHVAPERLTAVFDAATEEARRRTKQFIELPENESFRIEYVTGQVWGAYNWYQGNYQSLIQVNTDLPISISNVVHLACHEGYPGHHVYNALLESNLAKGKGWVEFTVYPLYSPQSLIAEGTAEYGDELAFSPEDRLAFEKEVLYPLAGLDSTLAEPFNAIKTAVAKLNWSSTDSARRYLNGEATRQETVEWLMEYGLSTPERAAQRVRFIEANRSYVVTYDVGLQLVRTYVESRASTVKDRWAVFTELLSTPQTPSSLAAARGVAGTRQLI